MWIRVGQEISTGLGITPRQDKSNLVRQTLVTTLGDLTEDQSIKSACIGLESFVKYCIGLTPDETSEEHHTARVAKAKSQSRREVMIEFASRLFYTR